jgi:hypothetical protein
MSVCAAETGQPPCKPRDRRQAQRALAEDPRPAVLSAVLAPVVTVLDDRRGSDNRCRSRDRPAEHAPSTCTSSGQRHVRLLPRRVVRRLRSRPAAPASGCGHWPRADFRPCGSMRQRGRPSCSRTRAPPRRCPAPAPCRPPRRLLGEKHREIRFERPQHADAGLVDGGQLGGLHRPVRLLAQQHQIEHANKLALDQCRQLRRHLTGEVGLSAGNSTTR